MSFKKCALKAGISSEDMAEIRSHIQRAGNDAQGVQDYLDGIDADLNDLRNQTGTQLVTEQVTTPGQAISGEVVDMIRGLKPDVLNQAKAQGYEGDSPIESKEWLAALKKFGPEGMTEEARMKRAEAMGYNTEDIYTHTGQSFEEIKMGGLFDGIFAVYGEDGYSMGGDVETKLIFKNEIAGDGDLDFDYDKAIAVLKSEYPELSDEKIDLLYEMAGEDANVFEMDENPLQDKYGDDLGLASWEGQRLRGRIAAEQGFDAVAMDDETGTSYLIPAGSSARSINAAFDPDFKDSPRLLDQPQQVEPKTVKDILLLWKESGIDGAISETNKTITVDKIIVAEGERGRGAGSIAMRKLMDYADSKGKIIALTPSKDFGAKSLAKVKSFYKKLGFIENKGKAKDFDISESMYRSPVQVQHVIPETIRKGSTTRTTKNSDGDYIAATEQKINDFWNFFGDSKIVDDKGAPKVVYSGTPGDLSTGEFIFDYSKIGTQGRAEGGGFYFTNNKKIASSYGNVISAYLAIEKPMAYDEPAFKKGVLKKLLKEVATQEAKTSGMSIGDGFLSNYGDVNYEGLSSVLDSAAGLMVSEDTALDQIGGLIGSGVDVQILNAAIKKIAGFDGVVAKGFGNEGTDAEMIYVAFFPEQVKSVDNVGAFDPADPNIFQQEGETEPQGQIAILPESAIIKLYNSANLSTFLHESAHLFLHMTGKLYSHPKASERIKTDGAAILKYLGAESFDTITTEQHETWARGMEKYFGEGKAPSLELQGAFRRFAQWIKSIYTSLVNLNVELTDDIREVMDRMLATDEQIDRLKGNFKPIFKDAEDAEMTKAEFKAYDGNASPDAAKEELLKKLIKELRRKEEKWWKDEKFNIQTEVIKELEKTPVYSAEKYLRDNKLKISTDEIKSIMPGKIPKRLNGINSKDGISASDLAPMFGFPSGAEMITQLAESKTIKQQSNDVAEAEMMGRHGDALHDGRIEEEAEQAMRNDSRAKKLLAELRSLSKKTKTQAIDRASLREYARAKIAQMKVNSISPSQFRAAEIRAARAAAVAKSKGDNDGAQESKTQEIINFYLGKEAFLAKDKAEKIRSAHKVISNKSYDSNKINTDYVSKAKIIIAAFDYRKTSRDSAEINKARLESARLWIESQQVDAEKASPFLVQAEILGRLIPYDDMTVEDLTGLNDTVMSLMKAGRETSIQKTEQFKAEMNVVGDYVVKNRLDTYSTEMDNDTPYIKSLQLFDGIASSLRKMDSFARQADGMNEQGMVWKRIIKPLLDASRKALTMRNTAGDDLRAIFKGYEGVFGSTMAGDLSRDALKKAGINADGGKITFRFAGGQVQRLSYGARISVALNMGNEGNYQALTEMSALPLTDGDVNAIVDTLTDRDWDLVQNLWDYIDTYWPMAAELEKSRSGAAPTKVQARSFVTPKGRSIKGGYYPLSADPAGDTKLGDIDAQAAKMMSGGSVSKATKTGSLIERTRFGGKKINFSINVVFNHIDEVIHDVSHWQAVNDVNRVLQNNRVNSELTKSLGPAGIKAIQQRLKEVAAGPQRFDALTWWERPLRYARLAVTYGALGYSVSTSLKNLAGLTTAVPEVGAVNLAEAGAEWMAHPIKVGKFIKSKSEYMVERGQVINRDIAQIRAQIKTDRKLDKFKDYAFWFMTQTDKAVTRPVWLAAYKKGQTMFDTEEEVIDYADQTVRRTQGSGDTMDLSNVETRSELMKTMTIMYSAMNAIYNIAAEQRLRYKARKIGSAGAITTAELFNNIMFLTIWPGLLMALIGYSDDDDEPEEIAGKIAGEVGGQVLGLAPGVREIYSLAKYGSSFPTPLVDVGSSPIEFVKQAAQGELDKGFLRATTGLMSAAHIPGGSQFNRTVGYAIDLWDGEIDTFSPWELLVTGKE